MKIITKHLSELSQSERAAYVGMCASSPDASIFHTLEWNEVLAESFGRDPTMIMGIDHGRISYWLTFATCEKSGARAVYRSPDRAIETVYGGPLAAVPGEGVAEFLSAVHHELKSAFVEMWLNPLTETAYLERVGYVVTPYYTSLLDLDRTEQELWDGMHSKTRNSIRKADSCGVSVAIDDNLISRYYEMVQETLGSRNVEVLPEGFYRKVITKLGSIGNAKLFVAFHERQPVGGALILFHRDVAYYWHGASFKRFSSLSGGQLLQWEIIKWARMNGCKTYDLLSVEPDRLPGIARFKMRFGGKTVVYPRVNWRSPYYLSMKYYLSHPSFVAGRLLNRFGRA